MEVEQKICPGCGAPLQVMKGTKRIECEYCHTVFDTDDNSFEDEREKIRLQMERDKARAYKERLDFDNKEYKRKKKQSRKYKGRQLLRMLFRFIDTGTFIRICRLPVL